MKNSKEKRGPGQPKAGGPRIAVRFSSDSQLATIHQAVDAINADPARSTTNRNRFIVDAVMKQARLALKK